MDFQVGQGPLLKLDESSALDIGACIVDGVDLAPGNGAVPDDGDPRILRAVAGFLFTCGPEHIRHPEPISGDGKARYPLHGSMSGNGAEILASSQSDDYEEMIATIPIALADGGEATVTRTWRMNAATGETILEDHLINSGTTPFAPMWMYHLNIGARLFDERTRLSGDMLADGSTGWKFGDGDGHVFCVPAEWKDDEFGRLSLGPIAAIGGKSLKVMFGLETLGHLQMWRNQQTPCNVLGIEPVSHPWKKRDELEELGLMEMIEPGDMRIYRLGFSFG